MAFEQQIQALTGTTTNSEINQWMNDGVRELTNLFPPHLKEYCYSKQTFTSAAANSEAETMITGQLGSVYAGSVECRQIRPMDKHKASSSTSIEYATATDPVYYVEGNKINILPASSSGVYYVIANPNIIASDVSTIDNFPNEAEYLVVLYAAIKVLQNKMNEIRGSLPSDISEPALSIMTSSLPVFQEPAGLVLPTPPDDADISVSFVKPVFNGVAPTYNPQVVAPDFADANTWLNTEEDSEMVAARMSVIQGQLQDYQAKLQNELNIFNEANVEYQSELQQYGTNIQNESERIQKEIQTYQAETGYDLSKYQAEVQSAVQKFQSDLSKNTTKFTNDSNNYSAELQKITQDNQSTLSKYGQDLQNFSAKIQKLSVDYQWYQGQQVKLQQDYNQGIQLLIGGGISPQKNKENK